MEDVTRFAYFPETPDQGLNRGMLRKITDPMGHETVFGMYNSQGLPERVEDPSGVVTTHSYDLRGRLVSSVTNGKETRRQYDKAGNLTALILPGGKTLYYGYGEAGKLEAIEDGRGNQIRLAYDTEGNRIQEKVYDPEGVLRKNLAFAYDAHNRLKSIAYPGDAVETLAYDDAGNVATRLDENDRATEYTYDLHRRLTAILQPGGVETRYAYDSHDNLIRVTDARGNSTTYTHDDLGRVVETESLDTGKVELEMDEAGILIARTDAGGVRTEYAYDAAGRLLHVAHPDASDDLRFTYDEGDHGKGRLTSLTDAAGRTDYGYDAFGRVVVETRTMEGVAYTTRYSYDDNGDLRSMDYPSGLEVTYERDPDGRVFQVLADDEILCTIDAYLPFGPSTETVLGETGSTRTREFDPRYHLNRISVTDLMDYRYTRDGVGNIQSILGAADPVGEGSLTTYEYEGNRLNAVENGQRRTFIYDANGNTLSDGIRAYEYNRNNRLARVTQGEELLAEYAYDGMGRRVSKVAQGARHTIITTSRGT